MPFGTRRLPFQDTPARVVPLRPELFEERELTPPEPNVGLAPRLARHSPPTSPRYDEAAERRRARQALVGALVAGGGAIFNSPALALIGQGLAVPAGAAQEREVQDFDRRHMLYLRELAGVRAANTDLANREETIRHQSARADQVRGQKAEDAQALQTAKAKIALEKLRAEAEIEAAQDQADFQNAKAIEEIKARGRTQLERIRQGGQDRRNRRSNAATIRAAEIRSRGNRTPASQVNAQITALEKRQGELITTYDPRFDDKPAELRAVEDELKRLYKERIRAETGTGNDQSGTGNAQSGTGNTQSGTADAGVPRQLALAREMANLDPSDERYLSPAELAEVERHFGGQSAAEPAATPAAVQGSRTVPQDRDTLDQVAEITGLQSGALRVTVQQLQHARFMAKLPKDHPKHMPADQLKIVEDAYYGR